MITYKIHLIRHGITDGNLQGKYIGVTDLPLSPDGVNELLELKGLIEYPNVKKVYTSPLLRARQSANILFGDTEQAAVENLKEFNFGIFENKTAAELESTPEYKDFISGKITAPPEGEDNAEFTKRICLGLNEMVNDMMKNGITNAAAVMHGGAIMMLLAACAVPQNHPAFWTSENGRGYTILITPSLYQKSGIVEAISLIPEEDSDEI